MRLSEQTNKFLVWMTAYRKASDDTTTTYGVAFRQFIAYAMAAGGTDDMRHFTPRNVQAFAEYLVTNGIAPATARQRLVALASFAKWAMRQETAGGKYLLAENPLDRVERPARGVTKSSFLYPQECRALLSVECRPCDAFARDMFFETGLRVSELSRANVEDFWETDGRHFLRVHLKGGRERNIPLGADMVDRLKDALLARNLPAATSPLLVNGERQRWGRSVLSEMIARIGKRAGITRVRIHPHMIRHTYNVVADQIAGLSVTVRAALLNHAGTGSLQKYDHLMAGDTGLARDQVRAAWSEYMK
ncbi:MAG TPA: tyrosine-type recombinase/integrase [Candidatus Binatia bacterium]|nr:tyrosine-type recombinase/integrase [Candidatus Binatia bacterium]